MIGIEENRSKTKPALDLFREILRLNHKHGLGRRPIACGAKVSQSTVHEHLARAAAAGVEWPLRWPAAPCDRITPCYILPHAKPDFFNRSYSTRYRGLQPEKEVSGNVPSDGAAPGATTPSATSFVDAVKSSNPNAYFRLESTSGTSEVGGAAYTSTSSVTSGSPGAPIGVSTNHSAVFNNKDGAITTTQMGGLTTAGSMMAWVKLADLPSKSGHILYVAGISQKRK
jgi:hypothetical protein